VLTAPGMFRMVPTWANGQPACAAYMREEPGRFGAHGICMLTVRGGAVTKIVSFNDARLLAYFGLPDLLPDSLEDAATAQVIAARLP
jgi:RNA polymerase sigma-70 factor (ECF subfamily)